MTLHRWFLWVAFTASAACAHAADPDSYVAVVSVDGLGASELFGKPSCLRPGSAIRALARRGAYSRGVVGVLPTITYPTHATIVTGATPERHGVVDNGIGGAWFSKRSDIRLPALWDAAREAGRTVAIVTWPSTYGAAANWLVPEDLTNDSPATERIRQGSTPGLFDALAAAAGRPSLLPFADPRAGTPLDEMTGRFAAEVVRRHKPQLLLAHFLDYDHRMHSGTYSQDACAALERIDGWIARLLDAYRDAGILDRTTMFVISDHGFLPVRKLVSVYALLQGAGWDKSFPGQDVGAAFDLKVAGGSVAFYPRAAKSPEEGRRMAARLKPAIEKRFGKLVRWVSPAQAHAFGGFPGAAFTLCARPGYSFTVLPPSNPKVLVEPGTIGGMHGYCPDRPEMDALFVASGHDVRAAGAIPKMAMIDMGPTIASFVPARLPEASGRDRSRAFRAVPPPSEVRSSSGPRAGR